MCKITLSMWQHGRTIKPLKVWLSGLNTKRCHVKAKTFRGFLLSSQGANDTANGLNGLNPKNTAPITPVGKRRPALIVRLVKHWVSQVETRPNV
jgi:hypothetical protein